MRPQSGYVRRVLLAVIAVNTTGEEAVPSGTSDGNPSLREAIEVSNETLAVSSLGSGERALLSGSLSSPNTIDFDARPLRELSCHGRMSHTLIRPASTPAITSGTSPPGLNTSRRR